MDNALPSATRIGIPGCRLALSSIRTEYVLSVNKKIGLRVLESGGTKGGGEEDETRNILKVGPLVREINSWDKEGNDGTGCMYIIACAQ